MILDLNTFLTKERPFWQELEQLLDYLDRDPETVLPLPRVERFHYLYQRASADLSRIATFSAETGIRRYLETLVGRAYAEIHESRDRKARFSFRDWLLSAFPRAFRRRVNAFVLCLLILLAGSLFGAVAIVTDPSARETLLPFSHLQDGPAQRVMREETASEDRLEGAKSRFSAQLMTHNIRVSVAVLALGMTWGLGSVIMLFYNGVILGAVAADYVATGETEFLLGWLLPHGSIEIPAILVAGQAGLLIAGALIGWGRPVSLADRFREISGDLVTLIGGAAVMLVWAGIVESFFSQYHEPVIPYIVKIAFGTVELVLLTLFLAFGGTSSDGVGASWSFFRKPPIKPAV